MMKLLERWKAKKSWKETLSFCPIYFIKEIPEEEDIDLRALLRKRSDLTLDLESETGFKEIGVRWLQDIPKERQYIINPLLKIEAPANQLAQSLIYQIEQYFLSVWDNSKFHILFMSGGLDSKILSYVLTSLRNKYGKNWLGDIHFSCREPEGFVFKEIMKRQEWAKDQYSIYHENRFLEEDYYGHVYDLSDNVNAFRDPYRNNYLDLVNFLGVKMSDCQVIFGSCGGEIFDYPSRKPRVFINGTPDPFLSLKSYIEPGKFMFSYDYLKWGDIILPYLSYQYLALAFSVPDRFVSKEIEIEGYMKLNREIKMVKQGFMRSEMLKVFGDEIPCYYDHMYNDKLSDGKRTWIQNQWLSSDFYRDFKHIPEVGKSRPHEKPWGSLDSKLYGLATVYQGI